MNKKNEPDKKVIPDELIEIEEKCRALLELRDKYATLPFGFRRAKKCAIEAKRYRNEFVRKIKERYPELGDEFIYNLIEKTIWKT